ncbi:MAG TPA: sugar phosphate isomerase/epimerase [Planctomycetaceae bacterium]|nr:sugar phosphate isomerase/epimerase [Planctomycetaceae bacterium]
MLRLSVSELSTFDWTFEEDVLHYHGQGFDAIGIWLPKLRSFGVDKGMEMLQEYDLGISSLQWIGGFTGTEGRSYRDALYEGFDTIQLAADIGVETVVVVTGGRGGHTIRHSERIVKRALADLAEAAQAVGVQLALEPFHVGCANQFSIVNTIPHCLDLISDVDNPHLGIVFDCYHLAQDPCIISGLERIVPFVRLVQLGDAKHAPLGEQNRCLLGHGRIPLARLITSFQQYGYRGYYEIEVAGRDVEHLQYEQILGQARNVASLW